MFIEAAQPVGSPIQAHCLLECALRRLALATLVATTLLACSAPQQPSAGEQDSDSDPQLAYAKAIPGFGGFYIDPNGVPTVYLVDVNQRQQAERTLQPVLEEEGLAPSQLTVRQGDYEYRQLADWFNTASREILGLPGIVLMDVDESRNRLYVGVENEQARARVVETLTRLRVPANAVVTELRKPLVSFLTLNEAVRPVTGGVRVAGGLTCSLGFNVSRAQRPGGSDNRRAFVTNSHCTNTPGGTENTSFGQPTSGSLIGQEIDDPAHFTGGNCPDNSRCRYSDAARVLYSPGIEFALAGVARTVFPGTSGSGSSTINGMFRIRAKRADTPVGRTSNKIGAATGWTVGRVDRTGISARLSGTNIVYLRQNTTEATAAPGDSGGPVFGVNTPSTVTLFGILWGGDGSVFVWSPMSGVERELGKLTTFTTDPTGTEQRADLLPEKRPDSQGPVSFCRLNGAGQLIVRIRNKSSVDVLQQTTARVFFSPGGSVTQSTPPIAGGASADVAFSIPAGCFDSDCDFTIVVDASLQVDESRGEEVDQHETNNIQVGRCIG